MSSVALIVTIRPAAGKTDRLRELLLTMVSHVTKEEPDCIQYQLIESKLANGNAEFQILEQWKSQAALENHGKLDLNKKMTATFEEEKIIAQSEHVQSVSVIAGFAAR
ncbi:MAG: hypothetical protein M1834_008220 [Cirrosporium novae-zelandiae]|nr:MAG: hypothetical protein M1834_008220 [Cirrosporium novae-zelandiae]